VPNEPAFSAMTLAPRVAPLAAIHFDQRRIVRLAEVQKIMGAAQEPKRLWIVRASSRGVGSRAR
jgi:hypothetical protein